MGGPGITIFAAVDERRIVAELVKIFVLKNASFIYEVFQSCVQITGVNGTVQEQPDLFLQQRVRKHLEISEDFEDTFFHAAKIWSLGQQVVSH